MINNIIIIIILLLLIINNKILPSNAITTCNHGNYYSSMTNNCQSCPINKPYTFTKNGKRTGAISIHECYEHDICNANDANIQYKWGIQQIYHKQTISTSIEATNYNNPSNIFSITSSFHLNNEKQETELIITNMITKVRIYPYIYIHMSFFLSLYLTHRHTYKHALSFFCTLFLTRIISTHTHIHTQPNNNNI